MKIWLFNNYNMLPEQGGLNRHYHLALHLHRMGHEPVAFVGSHPHNTDLQLIEGRESFRIFRKEPFPWVLLHTCNYEGSHIKRTFSMFEFYFNALKSVKHFERPDVVYGSSAHPLAAVLAIRLGRKYGCKSVVEIRDLWPESIVAYSVAGARNPGVIVLRWLEKWIYKHADAVVFTMEGAYDYIKERKWEADIPRSKVHFVNNGVDLEQFDQNRDRYHLDNADLNREDTFKVVYTGSIRKVNNLGLLLDAAKQVKNPKVRFLIWGAGDQLDALKSRVEREGIENVRFQGAIDKKYIPDIVSRADLNLAHNSPTPLFRFGISFNKLFDYLAGGKPVLSDFPCPYNPAVDYQAGTQVEKPTAENVAAAVEAFASMPREQYETYCRNARKVAEAYDYSNLTKKLISVFESIL